MENKVVEEVQVIVKHVFPALLKQKGPSGVRIWCPVCGTGEEATTLLIHLLEYIQVRKQEIPIQLFGTDTDEAALKKARAGLYDGEALPGLTPQQLKRFFIKNGKQYQANSSVRDICIFASQNLLTDPPFPRLDIISFKDSLVTPDIAVLQKILWSFHFGLKPSGFLLLNKAENLPDFKYFSPLPEAEQVYTRNPQVSNSHYAVERPYQTGAESIPPVVKKVLMERDDLSIINTTSEKLLLSRYVPASLVINNHFTILRFYGQVHQYLQPAAGRASLNAMKMLPEELALALQELILQITVSGKHACRKDLLLDTDGHQKRVTIEVAFLHAKGAEAHYLVIFKEREEVVAWATSTELDDVPPAQLPQPELQPTREYLTTIAEEYKNSLEEWQAAFEQVTATCEDLQQVNQALKQNEQELQGAVKDLMLANEDLEARNISLAETSDLSINVLEGIRDPLVLLNINLSVQAANKAFYTTFKLTVADVEGHFLYEIGDSRWNVPELLAKLSEVVSKKNSHTTFEVPAAENRVLLFNAVHIENGGKRNDRILISMQDVTQFRQAKETKEWLAAVVESSNEGIISFTTNKTIISWNKGAEEIFGYTEAEMIGKSITRLVKQSDKLAQHKLIERVMKGDIVRQLEMEDVHKDGRIIYVSTSIALIKDSKGAIKGLMASVQDITERKKSAEALRESEEQFRPIVSESSVGIVRTDFNGKLLFVNQKFCDMMGFSAEELLEKTVWDINYHNQIESTKKRFRQLQEKGIPFEYEKQLIRKDNTPLWVSINLSAIKDQHGIPFSLAAVVMDVSQRRAAEEALQQAKESLQMAQEAANMGSWEMNLESGQVIYHNLRNDQLMGYSAWQPDWNLTIARYHVIEEDKAVFDDAMARMVSTGKLNMEVRVRWTDGSIHWIYKAGQMSYDADGKPLRAAGIGMDITSHKLAEQRKEAFLGIASHELKTPVTNIKAYAQILQERFVEAEDYNSALLITKLDRQVDKLTHLIKDLLDNTRITEGQLSIKTEIVDLNALIREVVDDMQPGCKEHKIIKKLQPLPVLQADKERLRQVLMNLITNAIKYSLGSNKVIICSESDGKQVIVHVQDYGIGISPKLQQQVFDRFFRAGTAKDSAMSGLGLGLFISSEIVRQHKGDIWVTSEEGSGSTFSFSLPVHDIGV